MARPRRPARSDSSSRDRLLTAAREEFAARGFDGAKIDRIAARARLNKAMLYYHFRNKAALYQHILHGLFRDVADAVEAARDRGGAPDDQLRRFVETIARDGIGRPHFPPLWLREMADGGRHLDARVVAQMQRVIAVLAGVLAAGQTSGAFRPANPFVTHLGIVGPLLLFAASAPVRGRFGKFAHAAVDVPADVVVRHVQEATLAALRPAVAAARPVRPSVSRRTR
ncbi:MAG TPA: TetR/AcrR family transcriptional regulator [Vicinamibacterales bacterium]|nr:TetR/AcrR family transcriptional regulator [Vicinamibacterales bacterium]